MTDDRGARRPLLAPLRPALPVLAALAGTIAGLFNGFDTSFGPPLACLFGTGLLAVTLAAAPPRSAFWRQTAPVIALLAAAALWALSCSRGWLGGPALVPDLAPAETLGLIGAGAALIAGAAIGADRLRLDRTVDLLVGFGIAVTVIGAIVAQQGIVLSDSFWHPGQGNRFAGTFGNANVAGCFYAVIATLAAARAIAALPPPGAQPRSRPALLRWLICLIAFAACIATASRTATVTAVIAIAALLILHAHGRRTGRRRGRLLVGLGAAALALGLVLFALSGDLIVRAQGIDGDWALRRLMWSHYADVAARSPLFGYGLGSFPTVNLRHLADPWQAQTMWSANAAHNIALALVIEAGLPFLLLTCAALLWIAVRVARRQRAQRFDPRVAGLAAALLVMIGNATVDIALDVPGVALLFWLMLGLLWGAAPQPTAGSLILSSRQRRKNRA